MISHFPQNFVTAYFLFDCRVFEFEGTRNVSAEAAAYLLALQNLPPEAKTIEKQTKNRNETNSDLSLGERLTRLSKRLSRKRLSGG